MRGAARSGAAIAAATIALTAAACGGRGAAPAGPTGARCPGGDVTVRAQADVAALAGCRVVAGALVIRTGAPLDLRPLDGLEEVGGDLAIGPTLALTAIDGFGHLRRVGGTLRLGGNAEATGAWFPALERAGAVTVDGNLSLAELMAPRLAAAGDVTVAHNPALEVVDLGALVTAGHITFDDNRALGDARVPALGTGHRDPPPAPPPAPAPTSGTAP